MAMSEDGRGKLPGPEADDETDYIDYPAPHHEDCDCDGCMTFRVARDRRWSP